MQELGETFGWRCRFTTQKNEREKKLKSGRNDLLHLLLSEVGYCFQR